MKVVVSKEQFEQVRQVEKVLGVKIALALVDHQLRVVDNLKFMAIQQKRRKKEN